MKINSSDRIAFDRVGSARWVDNDGRLHVMRSNFTRVQVAPYRGDEIPDWEARGLNPDKIYHAYRPAEELMKEDTIKSIVGIPIQLRHNLDFPDSPAKDTRIGSTGDHAKFEYPFLSNSLHFQDQKAIDLINDGLMRELSLCYHYEPDFTAGETDDGKKYDFVMRNIRGQHLALVEEGRAGASCCVADSAEKVKDSKNSPPEKSGVFNTPEVAETKGSSVMDDDKKRTDMSAKTVEEIFELAKKIGSKVNEEAEAEFEEDEFADDVEAENESMDEGEEVENEEEEAEEVEAVEEVEEVDEDVEAEAEAEEDEIEAEDEDDEDEAEDEEEEESVEALAEKLKQDAFKWVDAQSLPEAVAHAFRTVLALGAEDLAKQKAGAEDNEAETKEERGVASDSALVVRRKLEKKIERKAQAIEDCRSILGRVKLSAFDSAGDVYLSALKQMGKRTKGVTAKNARVVFEAVQSEARATRKALANDSKQKVLNSRDPLLSTLNKIKVNR